METIAIIKDNINDMYIDISETHPIIVKIVIINVIIYKFVYVVFIFNLFSVGYTITSSDFNDFISKNKKNLELCTKSLRFLLSMHKK